MKKPIVLDCSSTMSWLMPDEITKNSETLLDYVVDNGAVVPSIWHIELGHSLLKAEKYKRINKSLRLELIETINDLPIDIDIYTIQYALNQTIELAEKYNLSLYDATYLELALRLKYPLASLDNDLIKAAKKLKLTLF